MDNNQLCVALGESSYCFPENLKPFISTIGLIIFCILVVLAIKDSFDEKDN